LAATPMVLVPRSRPIRPPRAGSRAAASLSINTAMAHRYHACGAKATAPTFSAPAGRIMLTSSPRCSGATSAPKGDDNGVHGHQHQLQGRRLHVEGFHPVG